MLSGTYCGQIKWKANTAHNPNMKSWEIFYFIFIAIEFSFFYWSFFFDNLEDKKKYENHNFVSYQ